MTVGTIQPKVTVTATGVPGTSAALSIAGISGDWTLVLEVLGVDAGVTGVSFQFEDSVNAFSAVIAGPVVSIAGGVSAAGTGPYTSPKRYSFKKEDYPGLRAGTTSAVIEVNVTRFSGSGNVTFQAFIEY